MSETMMETTVAGTSVVPSFEMPGHVLRHALAGALVATSKDTSLPTLTGVRIEWSPGESVRMVATDRYRLCVADTGVEGFGSGAVLVPRDVVAELVKALPKDAGKYGPPIMVTVTVAGDVLVVVRLGGADGSWSREVTLLQGEFPKYRSLVPSVEDYESSDGVTSFACNPAYMADVAKIPAESKSSPVRWLFRDPNRPALALVQGPSGVSFQYLLMPVKIRP